MKRCQVDVDRSRSSKSMLCSSPGGLLGVLQAISRCQVTCIFWLCRLPAYAVVTLPLELRTAGFTALLHYVRSMTAYLPIRTRLQAAFDAHSRVRTLGVCGWRFQGSAQKPLCGQPMLT